MLVVQSPAQKFIFSYSSVSVTIHFVETLASHLLYLLVRGSCLTHSNAIGVADLCHHFLDLVIAPSTISVLVNRSKNFIN